MAKDQVVPKFWCIAHNLSNLQIMITLCQSCCLAVFMMKLCHTNYIKHIVRKKPLLSISILLRYILNPFQHIEFRKYCVWKWVNKCIKLLQEILKPNWFFFVKNMTRYIKFFQNPILFLILLYFLLSEAFYRYVCLTGPNFMIFFDFFRIFKQCSSWYTVHKTPHFLCTLTLFIWLVFSKFITLQRQEERIHMNKKLMDHFEEGNLLLL